MEAKQRISFTDGNQYGCISVLKQTYIEYGEKETVIGNERRSFVPTQIKELVEYAPELENICKSLWTKEVIEQWKEHEKELLKNQAI